MVGALLAASTSLGSAAQKGSGCSPVIRTLANGDPALDEGAARVTVDGLGAYGRGLPRRRRGLQSSGKLCRARDHVHVEPLSQLRRPDARRRLRRRAGRSRLRVPVHHAHQIGALLVEADAGARSDLARRIDAPADLHVHEHERERRHHALVRHLDGDLRFDGSTQDGAAASGVDGRTLTELDSVATGVPRGSPASPARSAASRHPTMDDPAVRLPPDHRRLPRHPACRRRGRLQRHERRPDRRQPLRRHSQSAVGHHSRAERERRARTATRFDAENRAPTASDDAASTPESTPVEVEVRANDDDPDGDPLAVESVTQPAHGAAAIQQNGLVRYMPAAGFHGGDSFTYTVADGRGGTASPRSRSPSRTVHADGLEDRRRPGRQHPRRHRLRHDVQRRLRQRQLRDAGGDARPGLDLRRLERRVQWAGLVHGAHRRREDSRRRLPAAASDRRRVDECRRRPRHGPRQGSGLRDFVDLDGAAQVPIGTQLDTTAGAVDVTVSRGATLDTSEFYDGVFTVLQQGPNAIGELRLEGGDFLHCVSLVPHARQEPPRAQALG